MTKALQKCYSTQLSEIAAPLGTPWIWTPRRSHADPRLRADARGCNGGVRQELAAGIGPRCHWRGRRRVRIAFGAPGLGGEARTARTGFLGVTPIVTPLVSIEHRRAPIVEHKTESARAPFCSARQNGRPQGGGDHVRSGHSWRKCRYTGRSYNLRR